MSNRYKVKSDLRQFVVKSNDLIRYGRYKLTAQQQKIILYAISKIKPDDPPDTTYEINIDELCAACGIDIDETGGYYYKAIKDDLVRLTTRLWVKMPNNTEATVSWVSDAEIIPLCGKVFIKFHPKMAPYLFELRERYTMYHLEDVLVFKSRHSIRLYELLRSYTTNKLLDEGKTAEITFSIKQLREILSIEKYPRWADLKRYVIDKAIDEINECSDEIHIDYTIQKEGKKVSSIRFFIALASPKQMIRAEQVKKERLKTKVGY